MAVRRVRRHLRKHSALKHIHVTLGTLILVGWNSWIFLTLPELLRIRLCTSEGYKKFIKITSGKYKYDTSCDRCLSFPHAYPFAFQSPKSGQHFIHPPSKVRQESYSKSPNQLISSMEVSSPWEAASCAVFQELSNISVFMDLSPACYMHSTRPISATCSTHLILLLCIILIILGE
jgi:hypothetical protein